MERALGHIMGKLAICLLVWVLLPVSGVWAKPTTPGQAQKIVDKEGSRFYTLAAGGTVNRKKLGLLVKKLKAAGLRPIVNEETRTMDVFRLVETCYGDRKSAIKQNAQIALSHRDAFIIHDRESYCVVVGSFLAEDPARREQMQLEKKGLRVEVVRYEVLLPVWRISVGRYATTRDAEKAAKGLSARGIKATVVEARN